MARTVGVSTAAGRRAGADAPGALPDRVHLDDRGLAAAVLAGDPEAFRIVVERESAAVLRACRRILGPSHEAEDVAQESFLIAYRSIGSFRGDGTLRGWLMRIAGRHALRRASQRRETAPLDTTVSLALMAPPASDPVGATLAAERDEAVRRAVSGLPEPYREVVVLRFFGELSVAEIAAATRRPAGTVKTHLHRGLERVRIALGEERSA